MKATKRKTLVENKNKEIASKKEKNVLLAFPQNTRNKFPTLWQK